MGNGLIFSDDQLVLLISIIKKKHENCFYETTLEEDAYIASVLESAKTCELEHSEHEKSPNL